MRLTFNKFDVKDQTLSHLFEKYDHLLDILNNNLTNTKRPQNNAGF